MDLNFFKNWVQDNVSKTLAVPAVLSALTFVGNLAMALKDGVITDQEMHNLVASASGLESLVLFGLMIFLRKK